MLRLGLTVAGVAILALAQTATVLADTDGFTPTCQTPLSGAFFSWRKSVIDGAVLLSGTTKTQGDFNLSTKTQGDPNAFVSVGGACRGLSIAFDTDEGDE